MGTQPGFRGATLNFAPTETVAYMLYEILFETFTSPTCSPLLYWNVAVLSPFWIPVICCYLYIWKRIRKDKKSAERTFANKRCIIMIILMHMLFTALTIIFFVPRKEDASPLQVPDVWTGVWLSALYNIMGFLVAEKLECCDYANEAKEDFEIAEKKYGIGIFFCFFDFRLLYSCMQCIGLATSLHARRPS